MNEFRPSDKRSLRAGDGLDDPTRPKFVAYGPYLAGIRWQVNEG